MTTQKSLGQIAYEAAAEYALNSYPSYRWPKWETRELHSQQHHEYVAAAVARAVRKRGKNKE